MRVLIVEDEKRMAQLLKKGLERDKHSVALAHTGPDGLAVAQAEEFDVVVLDIMLPGLDGFEVARQLRDTKNRVPVLVLTARDSVHDIVRALDLGADDYLTKPFSFAEFLARVRAAARRGPATQPARLQVADLILDPATQEVFRSNRSIPLTKTEYTLLEFFMRRPGRTMLRSAIINAVWSGNESVENNTLDVFIKSLRDKIDTGEAVKLIQTVRGFGYRIQAN